MSQWSHKLRRPLAQWSLSSKLTLAYALLLVLVSGALAFNLYWQLRAAQRQGFRERLRDILAVAHPVVVGDFHAQIRAPADEETLAFSTMFWRLQAIQTTLPTVKRIYSLRQRPDGTLVYVLDATADAHLRMPVGTPYTRTSTLWPTGLAAIITPTIEEDLYTDATGQALLSGYAPIYDNQGQLDGVLGIDLDATSIVVSERWAMATSLLTFLLTIPLFGLGGRWLARRLTSPVKDFVRGAQRVAEGRFDEDVPVRSQDELGDVAEAFNAMQARLRISRQELETSARTLERRATQLNVAAEMARITTSILTVDELVATAVNLIQQQLGWYYVGIFLVDGDWAVLRAGTGEAGRMMLERRHKLPVGGTSMIGVCIASGQASIALDINDATKRYINPLLPDTHSEMALPLRSRNQVIGALTIQVTQEGAFNDSDLTNLSTIADQLGNAIENARLVRRMAQSQKEIERLLEETRQRAVEVSLARDAADAANRAKSAFLANMSHELRTPLNGILGYAQILKRHKNLTAAQVEGLDIIYKSGDHLLTLINDILDLAKIEANRFELVLAAVPLLNFLQGVAGIIRSRADQKDLNFRFETATPLPAQVAADEKRLRQVLLNLLGNAVKFTTQGSVILRAGMVDAAGAWVPAGPYTGTVRFEIIDTGDGMTPEALGRLFTPFEQAGDSKQRAEGTGLGLTISRRLVQAMGGDIQVHSQKGAGSTFWFAVALAEVVGSPTPEAQLEQFIIGYQGPRRKVLVVDDKEYNRALLVSLLEPLGFTVAEAEDGPTGIAQAQAFRPDVVLLDIVMPGMMGYDVAPRIRQLPGLEQVAIIAASASVFESDRHKVLASGCDEFIAKPIETSRLFAVLAQHLQLEWVYETPLLTTAAPKAETPLTLPPTEELTALHNLAQMGDLSAIKKYAAQLEARAAAYQPFAHKLLELAKAFESEAILALVESHLAQA